jgi:hypothetical protein
MFFWKKKHLESNWLKAFVPNETYTILAISTYNLLVKVMKIVKTLDNS